MSVHTSQAFHSLCNLLIIQCTCIIIISGVTTMWLEFACTANQHQERTIKEEKPTYLGAPFQFLKKSDCHPCFMIIKSILLHFVSSRINKPFTCSCCLISISCSAHTMWTYYTVCAKDHRFFIIITRKSTRSEDPTTWWFCIVSLLWPDNSRSPNWSILVAYSDIQITFASKFCFNLHWIFSWMSAF